MTDKPNQVEFVDLPSCALHIERHAHSLPTVSLSSSQLSVVTTMLKALADSNRLQLLLLLQRCEQPLCVSDIAEQTEDKITTVSNRLKQLHDAGLVTKQRDGQHILYALQDAHVEALLSNLVAHASH